MKKLISILFLTLALTTTHSASVSDSLKSNFTKAKVDSILIVGNEQTEAYIILRELTFQVGDTVTAQILHYNRERVFSLRLFNRVEIILQESNNKNIIQIEVSESWYIYPIPIFRINNGSIKNATYGINFTVKNFRGRNELLRTAIGFGYDSFISLYYDNPAFIYDKGIGISAGFTYLNYTNRSITAEKIVGYNFTYKMLNANLDIYSRLNQFNLAGATLGYDYWMVGNDINSSVTASATGIDRIPSLSIFYLYDTRDLKQYSENGIYSFLSFAHKGFGLNNISYNILEIDFREYRNLFSSLTSKWRINYRHTFGKMVPYYEYSYLGYGERIRGHYNDRVEGQNSFLSSIEFSLPVLEEWNFSIKLPLLPRSLTSARVGIFITTFIDGGMTYNNGDAFSINKFYSGYGIGVTFLALPYYALRFEYAINEIGKGELIVATGFSF